MTFDPHTETELGASLSFFRDESGNDEVTSMSGPHSKFHTVIVHADQKARTKTLPQTELSLEDLFFCSTLRYAGRRRSLICWSL